MRWRLIAAVLGALVSILVACQIVAGLEDRTLAGPDASKSEAGPSPDGGACGVVGTPSRNLNAPSSPNDPVSFTAALYSVDFGFDGGVGKDWGLNLDSVCTCPGKDSCNRKDGGAACDGKNGVDQGGRAVIELAENAGIISEGQLNIALVSGTSGALVRVDQWNGTDEDPTVSVSVFSSMGFGSSGAPLWMGNDTWTVERGSVNGGDLKKPTATTDDAYVTKGVLVASLNFPITVSSGGGNYPVTIDLTGGFIVATITKDANSKYMLSGTLAGRWATKTLLTSLQIFPDPLSPDAALCGDDTAYQILKGKICSAADINQASTSDLKDFDCDALGIGLHFVAKEAQLGAIVTREAGVGACGVAYQDKCP